MSGPKIFTYVSPRSITQQTNLCNLLPIQLQSVSNIEELFPLMSDPAYHTDFVAISVEMFYQRQDRLEMFDIIRTLATLITSTVHRTASDHRTHRRNIPIIILVDETTDVRLIRELTLMPDIASISWLLTRPEQVQDTANYVQQLISGDFAHHPRVTEMLKPRRKLVVKANTITLTIRQSQILNLIQNRGSSNKVIAQILGISESTVKLHVGAILKKYGAKNRTQLAVFARDLASQV